MFHNAHTSDVNMLVLSDNMMVTERYTLYTCLGSTSLDHGRDVVWPSWRLDRDCWRWRRSRAHLGD